MTAFSHLWDPLVVPSGGSSDGRAPVTCLRLLRLQEVQDWGHWVCDLDLERHMEFSVDVQNALQCYCVIYKERKRATTRHHWIIFSRRSIFSIQQETKSCAINVKHEWMCKLPSDSCCWQFFSSTIPHVLSLLYSVAYSLNAVASMPAVELYWCTFQVNTVRLKMLCF